MKKTLQEKRKDWTDALERILIWLCVITLVSTLAYLNLKWDRGLERNNFKGAGENV